MKSTDAALVLHMQGEATTLCQCIKITRADGAVFAFTDHDRSITVGGVQYAASRGKDLSAIITTSSLNVDNLEISGALEALGITESDVDAGVWDYADVRIFEVNWASTGDGTNKQRRGVLGEATLEDYKFTAEVRGLTQWLQTAQGETCSKFCKADLFDARCKVVATEGVTKFTGYALVAFTTNRVFDIGGLNVASGWFTNGKIVGATGLNAGITREIKLHTTGSPSTAALELYEEMPYDVAVSDTFTVYAGCRKLYQEDCIDKFSNGANFRGFPALPGTDSAFEAP